jgi:hypothetical protein
MQEVPEVKLYDYLFGLKLLGEMAERGFIIISWSTNDQLLPEGLC